MEITVTKQHNGILLSTIVNNQYYKQLYMDYTVKEAKTLFQQYVKEEENKIIREVK